ncbi:Hypothetical protein A7982_10946 [Minicystis rosea]|nr:Hypothetical protein A7982_10946 [Minicystis rosea]
MAENGGDMNTPMIHRQHAEQHLNPSNIGYPRQSACRTA